MSEAQWYVVHTYSGYENKVKVDIEKTIENRGLQDQMILLNSAFKPLIKSVLGAFSLLAVSPINSRPSCKPDYLVSLCIVCLLQNLQYFFVSMRSG